jgi:hypothetical protein
MSDDPMSTTPKPDDEPTPNAAMPPGAEQSAGASIPPDEQSRETPDLVNELREMGQQLESMFRAFIESERARQMQRDLAGGVQEITKQVQIALRSAQSNPRFQQAEERGRQVLNQAQQSKLVNDVQEAIVNGLGQLNEQIKRASERLQEDERANAGSGTTAQQVPIDVDEEQPATPPFERFEPGGPDVTSIPGAPGTPETQRLDTDDETNK